MARSVTFNGITRYRPGGITKINADALNQVGLSANNVIGLIGEADGGEPGSTAGLVTLNDPSRAAAIFKSGALVDGIRLAFQSSGDPNVPGGAAEVVVYKVNESTPSSIHIPDPNTALVSDTAAAGTTTTVVNLTTGGLTVDDLIGRWVDITVAALPGGPTYRRRITDNDATSITLSAALPSAPASGDTVVVRPTLYTVTSSDYGLHTTGVSHDLTYSDTDETYTITVSFDGSDQTSDPLGGNNYLQLVYRGGANAVAQDTILTPSSATSTSIDLTTGGLTPSAHDDATAVITNPATGTSDRVKIDTSAASSLTLESPGISDELLAEILTATPSTVTVDILNVTDATATITGAEGEATTFATAITGVTGDDLSISIEDTTTLNNLVDEINENTNYLAVVVDGINGDVELAKNFDFGSVTQINIQKDIDINGDLGFKQDLHQVITWINDISEEANAARHTDSTEDGSILPRTESTVDALFAEAFVLIGGTRGTSSNSDWQSAFDELLKRKSIKHVVPLIDQDLTNEGFSSTATWDSVAAQLTSHCIAARGASGSERGGYIGLRGTKAELIAAANAQNDMDIQLCGQNPTVLNASGTLEEKGPRIQAVMAASMRSGVPEVGEPLTHKLLRTSALTQDSSWDPADSTDAVDLIKNGILFAEVVPGTGIRWVRDLTTWVKNDNLAFSEGSVRDVVRFVAFNLRTTLENRFTGRKAIPATISSVKDTATTALEIMRAGNIIVDSTDPATGSTVRAYHNLKVFSEGDIIRLVVGVFPVPGINFQLSEIFLQLPTQSA